jgi:type III secretion protein C
MAFRMRRAHRLGLPLLLALLGCLVLRPAPVAAAIPDWGTRAYVYRSVEQDLRELLRDFASNLGLTLQLSEAVQGTVRGSLPPAPPAEFLDQLARVYGLIWYWDGFILWVYGLDEAASRMIDLGTGDAQRLADTMQELDLWDDRFPLRASASANLVLVTGPPRYVELVAEAAARLDTTQAVAIDIRAFPLRYASAEDRSFTVRDQQVTVPGVATILRRLLDTGELDLSSGIRRAGLRSGGTVRFLDDGADPGGAAQLIPPDALDGASAAKEQDTETRIQSDPRLNAVIIRDLADRMPIYERLIASLDRKQPLIELEVVIADISSDRLLDLGVDWRLDLDAGNVEGSIGIGDVAGAALRQGLTFTTAITGDPLSVLARIRALESRGEARILSRPAVLTFDNVEALFDKSETFFVRLEGQEEVDLSEITVGLLVKVTPRLIDEGGPRPKVQMTIDIEDGSVLPRAFQVDDIPSIERTSISTQGLVGERQGLVIGGFYRETQIENLQQVPGLGDIPILGWALFRNRSKENTSATRLFMIRPLVVQDLDERQVVSGSLTRDGPPAPLFRPDADLAMTPSGLMQLNEVRFGTLLGGRILGRAENTLCLARAALGSDCEVGMVPPVDGGDPFKQLELEDSPATLGPMPSLY